MHFPLSLPAFTTLSEAGVEGLGPVRIQAVPDWLQAQVDYLVEAELAAVNGGSFRLQGDEELLGMFGSNQTGLGKKGKGKQTVVTNFTFRMTQNQPSLIMLSHL